MHDGKRLIRADRYDEIKKQHDKSDEDMRSSGVLRIDPSFRIIGLAESPIINNPSGQWLNSELLSLFLFHEMRPLVKSEELHIIRSKVSALIVEPSFRTFKGPFRLHSKRLLRCVLVRGAFGGVIEDSRTGARTAILQRSDFTVSGRVFEHEAASEDSREDAQI